MEQDPIFLDLSIIKQVIHPESQTGRGFIYCLPNNIVCRNFEASNKKKSSFVVLSLFSVTPCEKYGQRSKRLK